MTEVKPDAKAILGEALAKKSPEDLAAYLEQACGGDRQLRLRVEAMLRRPARAARAWTGCRQARRPRSKRRRSAKGRAARSAPTGSWSGWAKREAARILGINRSTLDRKLERYKLTSP